MELFCPILHFNDLNNDYIDSHFPFLRRKYRGRLGLLTLVSGFFCPIHGGHIDYITNAAKLGDNLIVVVNSDEQWKRKKGVDKVWMTARERAKIISVIRCVDLVIIWNKEDFDLDKLCQFIDIDILANGGDRSKIEDCDKNELEICNKYNIELFLGVGGSQKTNSSSNLLAK